MLSVNTNLSSLIAQNSLNSSTDALNLAIERMTTGYKINHAKDNAANYAIATQMSSQLSSYEVASNNVAMGMDLVMTADGIINNMQDKASRLHALCIQSRNGTYGAQSLNAINSEVSALVSEIMRVYNTAEYNNISLFNNKGVDIDPSLPRAGASGFIDESTITEPPTAKYNGFIAEVVEGTPDVVVTNPTDLKTAIQNNTKIGIANAETLAQLATLVNNEGITCQDKTIILTEDIDLSAYSNWEPIGRSGKYYAGNFNGNGHTIKNLTINRPTEDYVGLFGYQYGNGGAKRIENVSLENVNIIGKDYTGGLVGNTDAGPTIVENCIVTGSVVGLGDYTGGLTGYGYKITNSYATGSVTGHGTYTGGLVGYTYGTITNCYATGNVTGQSNYTGGLAGYGNTIINSYATGSVTGQGQYTGGLAGYTSGTITNSYATGSVTGQSHTGGLAGYAYKSITNSYATGSVTGQGDYTGGLVGYIEANITNSYATGSVTGQSERTGGLVGSSYGTITNSYATGDVVGTDLVGGLVGYTTGVNITNSYATGIVTGQSFVGGIIGRNSVSLVLEKSCFYGLVNGTDMSLTGSLVGGFVANPHYTVQNAVYTLNTIDCQVLSGTKPIGGVFYETAGNVYNLQPDYDMSAMLAGVSEVELHNVTTTLQVGINSDSTSQISFDTNFSFDLSALTADITSDEALDCILGFIDTLSSKSTELGAVSNRLESALESISVNIENLTSSRSTIKDADIAQVSSEYIRQQILQQASATLLSTANQSPSIALQLI